MKLYKYIPDCVTSMNLVCGVLGIVYTFNGRLDIAFPLMLAATVFDFCDGLCARALNAYSDLGKELDSLCDLVSFGVLPSMMLYQNMKLCSLSSSWLCFVPILLAVFSAFRLAKFNVDDRQHHSFLGLPTPACALFFGAMCYFVACEPASFIAQLCSLTWFVPVLSVVMSVLLIVELPMISFKISKEDNKTLWSKRITFLAACIICIAFVVLCGYNWSLAIVLIILVYILLNSCFFIFER